jgi:lipopolysaccharide export system protein LptA
MKPYLIRVLRTLCLGSLLLLWPLGVLAAPMRTVEVLADEVEMDLDTGHTSFHKNVRIVLNQYRITCQKAEVKLDPKTRQLKEIIMTGSVIIQGKDGVVRSKKVIFNALTNKLRLEGTVYTRIQVDLPPEFKP